MAIADSFLSATLKLLHTFRLINPQTQYASKDFRCPLAMQISGRTCTHTHAQMHTYTHSLLQKTKRLI